MHQESFILDLLCMLDIITLHCSTTFPSWRFAVLGFVEYGRSP